MTVSGSGTATHQISLENQTSGTFTANLNAAAASASALSFTETASYQISGLIKVRLRLVVTHLSAVSFAGNDNASTYVSINIIGEAQIKCNDRIIGVIPQSLSRSVSGGGSASLSGISLSTGWEYFSVMDLAPITSTDAFTVTLEAVFRGSSSYSRSGDSKTGIVNYTGYFDVEIVRQPSVNFIRF